MKYLFALLALTMGCASTPVPKPSAVENPPAPPVAITSGTDRASDVNWRCELTEVNPSLAWVQCNFHNRSIVWDLTSACITVTFYDETSGQLVVESRKVCSGPLSVDGISSNYAAFTKNDRKALQRCGADLSYCVMLSQPVQ